MTGQTGSAGPEIHGKRVQLLKEAIPELARIAVMDAKYVDGKVTPGVQLRLGATKDAARALGVAIIPVGVDKDEQFEDAFAVITGARAEALIVGHQCHPREQSPHHRLRRAGALAVDIR